MQLEINLRIKLDSAYNISTGSMADSLADRPLIKDAGRRPVIPGSSLKGVLRCECERIARQLIPDFEQRWDCHPPDPDAMCRADHSDPEFRQQLCPPCRIFGAPWHPSPLSFSNLVLAPAAPQPPRRWDRLHSTGKTQLRFGVGINRNRGVAEDKILYSAETYSPPDALVYTGRIWGTLDERQELALLLAAIQSVIAFGASRSRGMGWWQVERSLLLDGEVAAVDEILQELSEWLN